MRPSTSTPMMRLESFTLSQRRGTGETMAHEGNQDDNSAPHDNDPGPGDRWPAGREGAVAVAVIAAAPNGHQEAQPAPAPPQDNHGASALTWVRQHKSATAAAVSVVIAAVALGWLLAGGSFGTRGSTSAPVEYVYLDSPRVNAYLGQLENGLASSEKRTLSQTATAGATVSLGTYLSMNGSQAQTLSSERTVTAGEGDRFYDLFKQLSPSQVTRIRLAGDPDSSNKLLAVHEGDFVMLEHARLASPSFALAVPALSLSALTPVEGRKSISPTDLSTLIAKYPNEVKRYLARFGSDPTFPLSVISHPFGDPGSKADAIRVPVLLSGLRTSPGLIGGDVTIFGKVVRQVRGKGHTRSPYDHADQSYFDTLSALAAERALARVSPDVARILHLPRTSTAIDRLVETDETLNAPGTVVLPVAIFT